MRFNIILVFLAMTTLNGCKSGSSEATSEVMSSREVITVPHNGMSFINSNDIVDSDAPVLRFAVDPIQSGSETISATAQLTARSYPGVASKTKFTCTNQIKKQLTLGTKRVALACESVPGSSKKYVVDIYSDTVQAFLYTATVFSVSTDGQSQTQFATLIYDKGHPF